MMSLIRTIIILPGVQNTDHVCYKVGLDTRILDRRTPDPIQVRGSGEPPEYLPQ